MDTVRASEIEPKFAVLASRRTTLQFMNPKIKTITNTMFRTLLTSFARNWEKPSRATITCFWT